MAHMHITPRRVAPYIVGGATGAHVLARMRHLSREPATDTPLYFFLLKNTDVLLALGGASVVIWQLAKHKPRQQATAALSDGSTRSSTNNSRMAEVIHELRQVFTALLIGLGLIDRKADSGNGSAISELVKRLKAVVRRGMGAVEELEPAGLADENRRQLDA